MANLGEFKIKTDGEYVKLSELTNITFEPDKTYTLQIFNGATLCESATTPTNGGFKINAPVLVQYTAEEDADLYIMTQRQYESAIVNIAE